MDCQHTCSQTLQIMFNSDNMYMKKDDDKRWMQYEKDLNYLAKIELTFQVR